MRALLLSQMNMYIYIYEKMYNTLYGDILPLVFLQYTIWNLFYPSLLVFMISVKMCIWQFWQVFTCASIWRPYHSITITEKKYVNIKRPNVCIFHMLITNFWFQLTLGGLPANNIHAILNRVFDGNFMSCDALVTTSATSSTAYKSHDASLCDMNTFVSNGTSISVSDGPMTDYQYYLNAIVQKIIKMHYWSLEY